MGKTKLGISVNVMGALVLLMFLFGGYVAGLLCVGYVFLCEEEPRLKKSAATAVCVVLGLTALGTAVDLLPDIIRVFSSLMAMFGGNLQASFVESFCYFLRNILDVVRPVVMIVLAVKEYTGRPFKLQFVDKLLG